MYFFRDSTGNEADLIMERNGEPMAIEIKAGKKIDNSMLRGLNYWQKYQPKSHCMLIHAGTTHKMMNDKLSVLPCTEIVNI